MSLKDDIKQKEFTSENQKALVNIIYTSNYIINDMNAYFKVIGITRQQYNVLRILRGQYPKAATVNLIKDRMLDKMSDVSRIVQRLEMKKLANKSASKEDKRVAEVKITEEGLLLLSNADKQVSGFEHFFDNLTEEETATLNNLLDKLRNSM